MSKFPMGKVVFFATANVHKFGEARFLLSEFGVAVGLLRVKTVEVQDDNVENIAVASVLDAVKKCCLPLIVEDAGLFVEALNGFPGPYSSYVFRTIGTDGILRLMKGLKDRSAYFLSAVAFCQPRGKPVVFCGRVDGKIAFEERGVAGFGFDPIFAPLKGDGRTFAEMSMEEKNRLSHRALALRKFAKWYVRQ